jgi:hypothetical protein
MRRARVVAAAFDAMSTWRIETANNSEKNSERVIEKMAAAARALGWPEQIVDAAPVQMQSITKMQIQTMDHMMDVWEQQIKSPNPMTGPSAMLSKLKSIPSLSPAARQRITRPIRLRGGIAPRNSASHERPREDWIIIAVAPIVSEETFALAQERLEANKTHAPRRTITPSVVQDLVSCAKCGYALYRTSTRSSARMIHYYRCLGSDAWRRLSGSVCNNHPVRQDLLDEVVWTEIVRLLEDPQLIQNELDRRLAAAREADPTKRREEALRRDLIRIRKNIDRLLTAYQEGLLSLDELRERIPNLRRREQADRISGSALRKGTAPCRTVMPRSIRKPRI